MNTQMRLSQKQKTSMNEKAIKREMKKLQKYLNKTYSKTPDILAEPIMNMLDQYIAKSIQVYEKTTKREMKKLQEHLHGIFWINHEMCASPIMSLLDQYINKFTLEKPKSQIELSPRFSERLTSWAQL